MNINFDPDLKARVQGDYSPEGFAPVERRAPVSFARRAPAPARVVRLPIAIECAIVFACVAFACACVVACLPVA